MNAELLLEHFHCLGDAPDAVPRLRRFILELATEGKLTEAKRVSINCKPLGKLADFIMGQAPPGSDCNERGEGTLFVKVGEFGSRYPEKRAWTTNPLKHAQEGDVLICVVGATIGKLNLGVHCAIGRSVAAIRPKRELDQLYLYYSLMPYTLRLREDARGTAQGVISRTELDAIEIWCPPLPEQHRIVAKVEELMALCDRLEAAQQQREQERTRLTAAAWQGVVAEPAAAPARFALEQLPALTSRPEQVKALRQTILDLAVRGRLVEQDERDEPAGLLLEKIAKEKERLVREGVIRKPKILDPIPHEALPTAKAPKGWEWTRLGTISTLITKGSTPTSYGHAYTTEGVHFIKIEAIENGRLVKENVTSFISEATHEFLSRSQLAPGDVLFSIAGSIGTCAIVDESIIPANTNQALAIIRGTQIVFDTRFLLQVLQSSVAHVVINKARGGAMNNISLEDIQNFIVPVPPLAEQGRIVAKVEELMALCDGLEAALREGEELKAKALEAVLRQQVNNEPRAYSEPDGELRMAAEP